MMGMLCSGGLDANECGCVMFGVREKSSHLPISSLHLNLLLRSKAKHDRSLLQPRETITINARGSLTKFPPLVFSLHNVA